MSNSSWNPSERDDAALALFELLDEFGDESEEPGPINPGSPLHITISEYRHSFPSNRLPAPDKWYMRFLLRYSRSHAVEKRLTTQDISDRWSATLYWRVLAIRRQFPYANHPKVSELSHAEFQRWIKACVQNNLPTYNGCSSSLSSSSGNHYDAASNLPNVTLAKSLSKVETNKQSKKRRGRPKSNYLERSRESQIVAEWQTAKGAGVSKAQFCKSEDITPNEFQRIYDRVRKRRKPLE